MMKRIPYYGVMALVGAIAMAASAHAQVTMQPTMSYQGYLTSASGTPLTGTHTMLIRLYADPSTGTPLWTESQTVTLNQGLFNVVLGKSTVMSLPFNRQYWIGVSLDGGAEMTPRTELAAVPYSLHSIYSDTAAAVMAGAINASSIANGSITLEKLSTAGAVNGQMLGFNNGSVAWITPSTGSSVSSINGITGSVEFVGTGGTTVTRSGNTVVINSTTGGGGMAGVSTVTSADGVIAVLNPNGPSVDLALVPGSITGNYLAANSVTESHLSGTISANRISGLPTSLPPSGSAGGDLMGTYPNPQIAAGVVGDPEISSVSWSKITDVPTSFAPSGTAGGVLAGTYPNPMLAVSAVTTAAIADNAVTNEKIATVDWSKITGAPTSFAPSGTAGGALAGSYPNPSLAAGAVTTAAIANNAVTNEKISSVSWLKITDAPTSFAPSGTAGGALAGTYPNPSLAAGAVGATNINTTGAAAGQTLMFNGTTVVWGNPTAGGLTLPYAGSVNSASTAFAVTNTGTGNAAAFTGGVNVANGSVLFNGTQGMVPATGAGTRLMWVPSLAAFRAGCVAGAQWDSASIGRCSFAIGNNNTASGEASFAAGDSSVASGKNAFALGIQASSSGTGSLALGGYSISRGGFSTAMGASTSATGDYATALGYASLADGNYTIAAGFHARACGPQAFSFGRFVEASGAYSIAIGNFASTNFKEGSIVIADNSSETNLLSTANNQLLIRAAGGTIIYSDASLTSGIQLAAGGGSWLMVSDRNKKENFRSVDGETVLGKLASIPVTSWNYKSQNRSIRHMGPMAQDFYAAFNLGESDTTITSGDIDGVNMLAIQALERRTTELKMKVAEFEKLRASYEDLRKTNDDLALELSALRAKVNALANAQGAPASDRPLGELLTK